MPLLDVPAVGVIGEVPCGFGRGCGGAAIEFFLAAFMISLYVTGGGGTDDLGAIASNGAVLALAGGPGAGAGDSAGSSRCTGAGVVEMFVLRFGRLLFRTRLSDLDIFLSMAVGVRGVFTAAFSSVSDLGGASSEYLLPLA